jgi:hypothetical protein
MALGIAILTVATGLKYMGLVNLATVANGLTFGLLCAFALTQESDVCPEVSGAQNLPYGNRFEAGAGLGGLSGLHADVGPATMRNVHQQARHGIARGFKLHRYAEHKQDAERRQ